MPRQKISEYRAKKILSDELGAPYVGWQIDAEQPLAPQIETINNQETVYVVKVDEAVKGRFKKGLVLLNITHEDLTQAIHTLTSKGFRWLIIEPIVNHNPDDERYISFMKDHSDVVLKYSAHGGVDIENNQESIQTTRIPKHSEVDFGQLAHDTGIGAEQLQALMKCFADNYFVFLEINPYLASPEGITLLDAAVEVDDAGAFFVESWTRTDFRRHSEQPLSEEEKIVLDLDENSPASFKLSVLEPNGSIFLLLSGGGASIVVADEVYNQGFGKQLGNYGEYSGNPNTEETYIYTKAVLELLLRSSSTKKVLFIGGAVANFTDVAKTFAGVIQAIDEVAHQLQEQGVKVYVRRGGPNQEIGLAKIEAALKMNNVYGAVHGPDLPLTQAVTEALQEIPHE